MKIIAQKEGEIVAQSDIHQEVFYIGRSRQNDLHLQSPKVSRRHAKIFFEDGQWFLEDLRSDNGTRYKGERVIKVNIRSGDKFYIGPFELELQATLPHKNADQVTVTSYIAPETVTSYQANKSDNFLESIAVTPQTTEENKNPKLSSYVATHSKGRLEEALTSESIHTVIMDEESDKNPSLKTIEPNEDSVKTMIEDIPQLTSKPEKSHARLVRLDQGSHGLEINLNKSEFILGNDEKSDIQIISDESPTRKATIRSTDSTFVIESTESESSTYVDGVPVKKRELENHDIIQVGKSRFEFLVGDSKSNVKTPKVIIRPVTSKISSYEEKLSDWKVLILIGISLGLIFILGLRLMSSSKTPVVNVATPESDRIVLYHLTEAQKLIDEGKLDEAEIRVKIILGKVSPNNLDALKMLRKIQLKRDDKKEQQVASDREVSKLLETHNALVQQKKFSEAKKIQQKINQLDNAAEKNGTLANLEAVTEQAKRVELAEKKNKQELNKIYFQGVEEYEDGRLGQAENLLKEVAAKEGHTYQRSAKKLLATIESQLSGQVEQELKVIKAKLRAGELLEANKDLQALAKKYPANKEVQKSLVDTQKLMEDKAKDVYRQGLATKEMAQDPAGAIDIFQKVLEYVPDPNHEYHKKAKSQINSLQLSP